MHFVPEREQADRAQGPGRARGGMGAGMGKWFPCLASPFPLPYHW